MKNSRWCTGALLLVVAYISMAAQGAVAQQVQEAEQQVIEAEQARVRALLAQDTVALARVLDDDLHFTHSSGWTESKAQVLESVGTAALKYEKMDHSELRARVYGQAAVLTGRSEMRVHSARAGGVIEVAVRFTAVYVQRDDGWRLAAWQTTRLP